jgi:hypothetical protein
VGEGVLEGKLREEVSMGAGGIENRLHTQKGQC